MCHPILLRQTIDSRGVKLNPQFKISFCLLVNPFGFAYNQDKRVWLIFLGVYAFAL
jgi:hypothetical protein